MLQLYIYYFNYIYGIYHWKILWSSYTKLAGMVFEPTITEFRRDALTDWAIRPWVHLALRANFVQKLQTSTFVQYQISFVEVTTWVQRNHIKYLKESKYNSILNVLLLSYIFWHLQIKRHIKFHDNGHVLSEASL